MRGAARSLASACSATRAPSECAASTMLLPALCSFLRSNVSVRAAPSVASCASCHAAAASTVASSDVHFTLPHGHLNTTLNACRAAGAPSSISSADFQRSACSCVKLAHDAKPGTSTSSVRPLAPMPSVIVEAVGSEAASKMKSNVVDHKAADCACAASSASRASLAVLTFERPAALISAIDAP